MAAHSRAGQQPRPAKVFDRCLIRDQRRDRAASAAGKARHGVQLVEHLREQRLADPDRPLRPGLPPQELRRARREREMKHVLLPHPHLVCGLVARGEPAAPFAPVGVLGRQPRMDRDGWRGAIHVPSADDPRQETVEGGGCELDLPPGRAGGLEGKHARAVARAVCGQRRNLSC